MAVQYTLNFVVFNPFADNKLIIVCPRNVMTKINEQI